MNDAKELIEAAKRVDDATYMDDIHPDSLRAILDHILSTVRPDDDEPVTRDRLEAEPGWRLFHADDRTVLFIHDAAGVNLAFSASRGADAYDAMWIGGFVKVKSLGHLRRLVAALGE